MGGSLWILSNPSLTSLEGRASLDSVGEDLSIRYNACLSQDEAEAFAASIDVGGTLYLSDNGANYPCD